MSAEWVEYFRNAAPILIGLLLVLWYVYKEINRQNNIANDRLDKTVKSLTATHTEAMKEQRQDFTTTLDHFRQLMLTQNETYERTIENIIKHANGNG